MHRSGGKLAIFGIKALPKSEPYMTEPDFVGCIE